MTADVRLPDAALFSQVQPGGAARKPPFPSAQLLRLLQAFGRTEPDGPSGHLLATTGQTEAGCLPPPR